MKVKQGVSGRNSERDNVSEKINIAILNAASQLMAGGLEHGSKYLHDGDTDCEDYQKFMKSRELQFRRAIAMVRRCYDECLPATERDHIDTESILQLICALQSGKGYKYCPPETDPERVAYEEYMRDQAEHLRNLIKMLATFQQEFCLPLVQGQQAPQSKS